MLLSPDEFYEGSELMLHFGSAKVFPTARALEVMLRPMSPRLSHDACAADFS